ncbi:MAG: vanadium-dependent haloperoxidase [Chitinophagaceae bacterium]
MKIWILAIIFLLFCNRCIIAQNNLMQDAAPLHRAEKALTDVMVHDVFSPNVASRIYLYANIAAYEVLVKENKTGYYSLHGKIKGFPNIPTPGNKVHYSLAAVNAFMLAGKKLIFSEPAFQDSINNIIALYRKAITAKVFDASISYGKQVSDSIIAWSALDQYKETRRMRRYNFSKQPGKWIPTPPGYMAAVEPYWNKIRTVTLDSASQFKPAMPTVFSVEKNSPFYNDAYEVYNAGVKMTSAQRDIANFWDCNPFFLNVEGHLNFAGKKISPSGHWISIVGIACKQTKKSMMESAAAYTLASIALFDGFISCWDEKYRSNLIRPETYINAHIDETWRPLLQTPPFPEYTSGHSVISSATAVVLESVFGKGFSFDDSSEQEFGLPVRHFNSLMDAANEAAISRLYGGIHYRPAIENGQTQGKRVGEWVLAKIKLKE